MAVPDDAAAIVELLRRSFIEYKSLYSMKGFLATTPGIAEILNRIEKKTVWVALYNNSIAGTISIFPSGKIFHLRSMAVVPSVRGQGLGLILLLHAQNMAVTNGAIFLMLYTTPFLQEAIQLYKKFGFKKDGYDDLHGTPLIRMTRSLKYITQHKIENDDHPQ